ncbi:MAG: hypothetical protein ABSC11_15410 [Smithella sp.]|jgi:hypothetical protein
MKKNIIIAIIVLIISQNVLAEEMFPGLNKKNNKHSLGLENKIEISLADIFRNAELQFKVEYSPLKDGTVRRIITVENSGAILYITGNPDVISSSVIIVPSKENIININSLLVMGATMDTLCTHNYPKDANMFLKKYSDFIGSNKTETRGTVGKCKYEMFQSESTVKNKLYAIDFKSKN